MGMGKAVGLALAGCGLLAAAPSVARADDEPTLQEQIRQLEAQVQELKAQVARPDAAQAEPLSVQVDRYLQEQEKGALWTDKSGKPLGKVLDSIYVTMWMRARPTWSDNYDLDDDINDNGFSTFFRGKLGVGAKLKGGVGLYTELDFEDTWGNTSTVFTNDSPTSPTVQQAYVDGIYSKHLRMDTRIGRFEMEYGDEFVFGENHFAQTSTYYDGVKVARNYEKQNFSFDAWAVKLVDGFKNPLAPSSNDSVYMVGVYGNYYGFEGKTGMPGGFEPYYVWIYNGLQDPGDPAVPTAHDIHTAGIHWYGDKATKDKAGIGWNVNAAGQYFHWIDWAADARVMYTMSTMKYKPVVFGQAAYASGDRNEPGYNPLFQDVHGRYGWADMFTFSNLAVFGGGAKITPVEGLTYALEARSIHQARSTVVQSSQQLAWEFDFVVTHKYSENVDIECAYSYVLWREVENASGSAANNTQRLYFQFVVSF